MAGCWKIHRSKIAIFPLHSSAGEVKFWFMSCCGGECAHFSTFWRDRTPPPGKFSTFSLPTPRGTNIWHFLPGSCTATNIAKPLWVVKAAYQVLCQPANHVALSPVDAGKANGGFGLGTLVGPEVDVGQDSGHLATLAGAVGQRVDSSVAPSSVNPWKRKPWFQFTINAWYSMTDRRLKNENPCSRLSRFSLELHFKDEDDP